MALANILRKKLFRIRAIPGRLGLRPYSLAALDIDYGADFTSGLSTSVNIREFGGQVPKTRWLTSEERVVGGFADATIRRLLARESRSVRARFLRTLALSVSASRRSDRRSANPNRSQRPRYQR